MTEALPPNDRATTAAARRRVAAADRARRWREEQRVSELARIAELGALRDEIAALRVERKGVENEAARLRAELCSLRDELGRMRAQFDTLAKTDMVDEDLARALVRMGGLRRSPAGPLAIGVPKIAVADVVAAAALIRCGGQSAGQAAYDAARARVLARLSQFVLPPPRCVGTPAASREGGGGLSPRSRAASVLVDRASAFG